MRRWRAAAVTASVVALAMSPSVAHADHDAVNTVATGLGGPRQVNDYEDDDLVVAESDTGEVSRVDLPSGEVETLLSDLPIPQGVAYEDGLLYVALGEPGPDEGGEAPAEPAEGEPHGSSLIVAEPDGEIVETFDLLEYELENNPDDQPQFAEDGTPFDALSNPFAVQVQDDRILVADAGANALLAIDRDSGEISTLFVPPQVSPDEVPECADAQANPDVEGCDPVPTGIDVVDGKIYLSTLGAEAPGAARVYVLEQDGEEIRRIEGLTGITGLAVQDDDVYVSELFFGAPEEEPGPDFDPTPVGRLVKIDPDGDREAAAVTLPAGLEFEDGDLYASAWSVAIFLGLEDRGEVVKVDEPAFHDLDD
jgi:sugar lactone lactonase YvrE